MGHNWFGGICYSGLVAANLGNQAVDDVDRFLLVCVQDPCYVTKRFRSPIGSLEAELEVCGDLDLVS